MKITNSPIHYVYRRALFEDVSLVCDDHLAPKKGRKFSSANMTVENLKEVGKTI